MPDNKSFFCPTCNENHLKSDYLTNQFKDQKTEWLANMITHYRHDHTDWDDNWPTFYDKRVNYNERKLKQNDKIKKQILKDCKSFLLENGISTIQFEKLQSNNYNIDTRALIIKNLTPTIV